MKILWRNRKPEILYYNDHRGVDWVVNGNWDIKINFDSMRYWPILYPENVGIFDTITDAPEGTGYNDIMWKARDELEETK